MIEHNTKTRRLKRIRSKLAQNRGIPRLTVHRTNRHIWAQIIDDKHGKTIVSASSKTTPDIKGTKIEKASQVGKYIAKKALENKVTHIRFDRGYYRYHGRVKALAQAARQAGLNF